MENKQDDVVYAIMKTLYVPAYREMDSITKRNKTVRPDFLMYIVGGSDGSRELKIVNEPNYTFKLSKIPRSYAEVCVPESETTGITCKYNQLEREMSRAVGLGDAYNNMDFTKRRDWVQRNLYNNPMLYMADMNIEDQFKIRFNIAKGNNIQKIKLRKSFMDIEVRSDKAPWEQHQALAPISSICHIDVNTRTLYVMVVEDPNIPNMQVVKNDPKWFLTTHFLPYLKECKVKARELIKKSGGNLDSVHPFDYQYVFNFVPDEASLIKAFGEVITTTKPDTCGIWNSNFDILTIQNRAYKLGLNMADIFSDPSIPTDYRYYRCMEDPDRYRQCATHYSRYWDNYSTTCNTQFYDQESMFSNLRRRYILPDYKLDSIAEANGFINKVDLSKDGLTIKNAIYKDFFKFLTYAMMDPINQDMIEYYSNDVEKYFYEIADTRFSHGVRKTSVIKNDLFHFFRDEGMVIGNNVLYDIEEKVDGAIIASVENMLKRGIKIFGKPSNIFKIIVDLDASSEYPNIMISYNIMKTTMWGRIWNIYTPKEVNGYRVNPTISDGATFAKMLQTIDTGIFDMGKKYFNLPSVTEVMSNSYRFLHSKKSMKECA